MEGSGGGRSRRWRKSGVSGDKISDMGIGGVGSLTCLDKSGYISGVDRDRRMGIG